MQVEVDKLPEDPSDDLAERAALYRQRHPELKGETP